MTVKLRIASGFVVVALLYGCTSQTEPSSPRSETIFDLEEAYGSRRIEECQENAKELQRACNEAVAWSLEGAELYECLLFLSDKETYKTSCNEMSLESYRGHTFLEILGYDAGVMYESLLDGYVPTQPEWSQMQAAEREKIERCNTLTISDMTTEEFLDCKEMHELERYE